MEEACRLHQLTLVSRYKLEGLNTDEKVNWDLSSFCKGIVLSDSSGVGSRNAQSPQHNRSTGMKKGVLIIKDMVRNDLPEEL